MSLTATSPTALSTEPPVGTPRSTRRDPFLDNARYWVMLLVVVGHFMTPLLELDAVRGTYLWIYLFHMPVFILISGYTARSYTGTPRQVRRMVSTLVVPYLAVETGLEVTEQVLAGEPIELHVLEPDWLTWFIAALFVWRLTTPIWRAVRYPVAVSVAVSLLGGLTPVTDVLAIPQIIALLPFYVIGLQLRPEHFERLSRLPVRVCSAFLLVSALAVCLREHAAWTLSWIYWRDAYSEAPLLASPIDGMLNRAMLLAVGLVLAAAAMSLVPQAHAWYTALGQRTLYCYLVHGFLVLVMVDLGVFAAVQQAGGTWTWALIATGVPVASWLMTKVVADLFRPVFEPRLGWLFRAEADHR